ncbi:unnamed protein product [Tetraodon nigroviridis]|uniref:(spotted green pufferfish) hypothetical protein n=1 Tax=Tetraodon nigroviridis TaxID=99883 RepID=Q4TGM2_TETNG|nr:unnamed protein product [Tetraodon nigroviridis]
MELLYASSGDLSCESPTGDFPSPLPALPERQEGLSDTQSQASGQTQDREQTSSPSSLTSRPGAVSGARTPTGSERRQMERSPLSRRKQTPTTTQSALPLAQQRPRPKPATTSPCEPHQP